MQLLSLPLSRMPAVYWPAAWHINPCLCLTASFSACRPLNPIFQILLPPNLRILVPRDDVDMALMLEWAVTQNQPVALRYARDNAPTIGNAEGRDIARAETLREGDDVVFLTVGPCAATALKAAERLAQEGCAAAVVDARSVKPLDAALLDAIHNRPIITVEENALAGGFGSAVLEYYEQTGQLQGLALCRMGLDDIFYEQASRKEQLALCKLDVDGLYNCASQMLATIQNVFAK